jgi:DNA (cytosine-5)-methyltransferase 1
VSAYYNEFDPKAAAWLRELIKRGLIADGVVDERSILDVSADDLVGFTQCHFFAGIGGWSYALRLAGWSDDQPVWTGSPPCQPFSAAGQQKGKDDDRHLAPHFAALIVAGRPPILFGEQVASAAVFGKAAKRTRSAASGAPEWTWIDDLQDRLEAAHYAVGASDIPAAGVGAPHIRQRTFFGAVRLGDPSRPAGKRDAGSVSGTEAQEHGPLPVGPKYASPSVGGLADATSGGRREERALGGRVGQGDGAQGRPARHDAGGDLGGLADANGGMGRVERPSPTNGHWRDADWLFCRDGKWRPVEPGTFPLAHGVPARVGRLRGYGNAIVPQAAALFVTSFLEAIQ